MGIPWVDGLLYCLGLVLVFTPAHAITGVSEDDSFQRITKHVIGLIMFATGTIGIHLGIREQVGNAFLFWSLVAIMILSLVKVWWETRDST